MLLFTNSGACFGFARTRADLANNTSRFRETLDSAVIVAISIMSSLNIKTSIGTAAGNRSLLLIHCAVVDAAKQHCEGREQQAAFARATSAAMTVSLSVSFLPSGELKARLMVFFLCGRYYNEKCV